jgi:hypothetical protein
VQGYCEVSLGKKKTVISLCNYLHKCPVLCRQVLQENDDTLKIHSFQLGSPVQQKCCAEVCYKVTDLIALSNIRILKATKRFLVSLKKSRTLNRSLLHARNESDTYP